jgi:hypothetical protein
MVDKPVYFSIKKRLPTENDQEPPLFPWETSVQDYAEDGAEPLPPGHDKSDPPPAGEPPADE